MLDVATNGAALLRPGFEANNDIYRPLYRRLRVVSEFPQNILAHIRRAGGNFDPPDLIVFHATITDEAGRILAETEET